jgi:hypothetical protein
MKGPNMDSGHLLQTVIIKEKLLAIYKKKTLTIKKME